MLFALLTLLTQTPSSSGPKVIALDKPDRVLATEFSQIRGARELPDGRVILSDRLDRGVVVVNFATNSVQKIGATGRGPTEYRLPTALIAIGGDSTLLSDEGNSRLAVIGPDLKIHRSFTLMVPGIPIPSGSRMMDASGRHYLQIPAWVNMGQGPSDSAPVVRFDPRTQRIDTLVRLKGPMWNPPGPSRGIPYTIFAAQDVWTVSTSGRMAIVHAPDYRVEWREPDGRVVRGPVVAYERLPVTMEDKTSYVKSFLESSNMSGKGPDGAMGATPPEMASAANVRELVARNLFAEVKPPIVDRSPLIAPEGTLWVERTTKLGDPPRWDVFDASGNAIARVTLPKGRSLIALGAGTLYAVATNDDDLQVVERYRRSAF